MMVNAVDGVTECTVRRWRVQKDCLKRRVIRVFFWRLVLKRGVVLESGSSYIPVNTVSGIWLWGCRLQPTEYPSPLQHSRYRIDQVKITIGITIIINRMLIIIVIPLSHLPLDLIWPDLTYSQFLHIASLSFFFLWLQFFNIQTASVTALWLYNTTPSDAFCFFS